MIYVGDSAMYGYYYKVCVTCMCSCTHAACMRPCCMLLCQPCFVFTFGNRFAYRCLAMYSFVFCLVWLSIFSHSMDQFHYQFSRSVSCARPSPQPYIYSFLIISMVSVLSLFSASHLIESLLYHIQQTSYPIIQFSPLPVMTVGVSNIRIIIVHLTVCRAKRWH